MCHYDPHGIVSSRRKEINSSTYEHDYILELELKANLYSWPINTEMEIETPSTKEKSQERSINEVGNTDMEDASSTKKVNFQDQTKEEIKVELTKKNLEWPGFQVQLEDPQCVSTYSSIEIVILGSVGSTSAVGLKWEEGKLTKERNTKFRDEMLS